MAPQVKESPLFTGSIEHTLGRLLLWSQRSTRGMARVEFYSEFSRRAVSQQFSAALQEREIPFTEIRLPLWGASAQVLNFLLEEMERAQSGVISIIGFETAFNSDNLRQALGALNFNRENLARFDGRQIWWMSHDFLNQVISLMPDLNSWFTLRLSLTEITEIKDSPEKLNGPLFDVSSQSVAPEAGFRRDFDRIANNLPKNSTNKFIGREEYLIEIEAILATDNRVVLQGMGGFGKSELALQYAWRQWHNHYYPGGICWLNAFDSDLGLQILNFAYSNLGLVIPLDRVLAERVAFCWQNWPSGQVLIIIDDLRDYGLIESFLPPLTETRFHVIITSRFNYLRYTIKTINLDVLSSKSALELLSAYVTDGRIDQQLEQARLLCQDLGYLPLALELVGRLLEKNVNWTVQFVRQKLVEQGLETQSQEEREGLDAEIKVESRVKAVFESAWLELSDPAQNLAMHLSLFAPAPFSTHLIYALLPDLDPRNIEELLSHGLVQLGLVSDLGNDCYELHTLIRAYCKEKLEKASLKDKARQAYCQVMVKIARNIKQILSLEDIARLTPYIDHLKVAAGELNQWLDNEDLLWLFMGLGFFYQAQGLYQQAVPYFEQCLSLSQQRLGEEHPDVAQSLNNLAALYDAQGRYAEAEPLYRRSLAIWEKQLGENHRDVAISLNNLAALYDAQGRYAEAEPLYRRSLAIWEKKLGDNHPDIATSLNNLAALYESQGKYREAEPLYRRALAIRGKVLGKNHPHVAQSFNNLATLYERQGKYEKAEPLYRRALAILEKQLGENHPDVAISLNNLAALYDAEGKYEEAEPLYRRSLAIGERQLGENHPFVAQGLSNLASLYHSQGKYAEAEPLYQRSLAIWKKTLGEHHPNVAQGLDNLASLYHSQEKYEEVETLHLQALAIREQQLGSNHPDVATSLNNLASLYKSQRKYEEAEPLYLRALAIREQQLGSNHPDVATSLNNLASLYKSQGKYTEAEPLYQRSLAICEQILGAVHPQTMTVRSNYAHFLKEWNTRRRSQNHRETHDAPPSAGFPQN